MNPFAIVDRDEGRRIALKVLLEPEHQVREYQSLQQVGQQASGGEFGALFLAWKPGGPERLETTKKVEWTTKFVVPVSLLPWVITDADLKAEWKKAEEWSIDAFPDATFRFVHPLTVRAILRVLSEIVGSSQEILRLGQRAARDAVEDQEVLLTGEAASGTQQLDCEKSSQRPRLPNLVEGQRILGPRVRVLRKLAEGAFSAVFLAIGPMGHRLVYKLVKSDKAGQLEALKKTSELIWCTAKGTAYLLNATAGYCEDTRFYYIATPLLDGINADYPLLNCYRPKTLAWWLRSLRRPNGVLSKEDALVLFSHLISILEALSFLHRLGLVYNDVHPGNIGFYEDKVMLIDHTAITFPDVKPTPAPESYPYAPPKGQGWVASPAFDSYCVVKILVEGITQKQPEEIRPESISDIASEYFKGLFHAVDRIARKGLQTDPTKRYQSAEELMDDLEHARQLLAEH